MARFIGGPYDGMEIGHELLNQHGHIMPISAGGQNRLFVAIPPREQWDRLCRGEITKEEAGSPLHPYERIFVPGGAEFHDASQGRLDQAASGQPDAAFVEAMENQTQEERLAALLTNRMAQFLAAAHLQVIPPGTLGAGMNFHQTNDVSPSYDLVSQTLSITGIVTIKVQRTPGQADE